MQVRKSFCLRRWGGYEDRRTKLPKVLMINLHLILLYMTGLNACSRYTIVRGTGLDKLWSLLVFVDVEYI